MPPPEEPVGLEACGGGCITGVTFFLISLHLKHAFREAKLCALQFSQYQSPGRVLCAMDDGSVFGAYAALKLDGGGGPFGTCGCGIAPPGGARDAATLAGPAFSGATVAVDLAMDAQLVGRGAEGGTGAPPGGDSPPGGVRPPGGL